MTREHDELPLPEYDHIPVGTLPARISSLDETEVGALLDYERRHGGRLPVVTVLEHRLEQLRNGAEPSGSLPRDLPEVADGASRPASRVSPATSGPVMNPPSQGVPTNPAQPR
jgi:hypothetical protein